MCEIHKARLLQALLFWRPSHSDDWPLQLSASLAANSWSAARDLCVSATSFLRLSTSAARSPCWVSFCLDRCCQSGNFLLLRCNESRMVGLAVLFLLLGGHQLLQNAQRSRRSVVGTHDWHRAPRKKTAWNDHHRKPCSSSIRANGYYVNRKQHIWQPHKGDHGYSCRLPAPVFSPL